MTAVLIYTLDCSLCPKTLIGCRIMMKEGTHSLFGHYSSGDDDISLLMSIALKLLAGGVSV